MPQCKRSDCREAAVPGGKQYCPEHLAAYKQRSHEAAVRWASLPECANGCGRKVGPLRREAGYLICSECEAAQREREIKLRPIREVHRHLRSHFANGDPTRVMFELLLERLGLEDG